MRWIAGYFLLSAFVAPALSLVAAAQSVQPVIEEYTTKASGSFVVSNDLPVPIFVNIHAESFVIDHEGKATYSPLNKAIHLNLSTTSLRLPPKQTRTVFYAATADQLPAWFTIYSTLMGLPGHDGVNVQLRLPHTVYIVPKGKVLKSAIELRHVEHGGADVTTEVVNVSDSFVRASAVEVSDAHGKKYDFAGFPLLPHSERDLTLPVGNAAAAKITVKFNDFSVEQPIQLTQTASTTGHP